MQDLTHWQCTVCGAVLDKLAPNVVGNVHKIPGKDLTCPATSFRKCKAPVTVGKSDEKVIDPKPREMDFKQGAD